MKKILLTLEYDGTAFAGWQLQHNALSVQQVMEEALAKILGENVRLSSSGRTDAGVHAKGMAVHFSTTRDLPLTAFREGVNRHLPREIAVRDVVEVPLDFHSRFSARGKWYRYTILNTQAPSPLVSRFSWHIRAPLDLEAMADGAAAFVGCHDFAAFRAASCDAKNSVREIFSIELEKGGDLLQIDFKGKGFLRNMVRIMTGTLVEIGLGKRSRADVAVLLREKNRLIAGPTAPANGLCLMEVWY